MPASASWPAPVLRRLPVPLKLSELRTGTETDSETTVVVLLAPDVVVLVDDTV